jgi:hypothetical protein
MLDEKLREEIGLSSLFSNISSQEGYRSKLKLPKNSRYALAHVVGCICGGTQNV